MSRSRPLSHRHAFRRSALLLALALIGGVVATVPAGAVGLGAPAVSTTVVVAPVDYFANQWYDPMDFSNDDIPLQQGYFVHGGSASISGGQLHLNGVDQIFFSRHDPGGLPTSTVHDPRQRVLDGDRYSRISFRMHSDRAAAAAIGFRTCDNCPDGHKYFDIVPGWHTYDLDMKNVGGPGSGHDVDTVPGGTGGLDGAAWAGSIGLVWMSPAFNVASKPLLDIDDVAIYQPSSTVTVTMPAGSGSMDLFAHFGDGQGKDAPPFAPGDSSTRIGSFAAGSTVTLQAGILRPDVRTRFWVTQGASTSGESAEVVEPSNTTPSPQVLDPSEAGGADFATTVRGDPWDFNQPTDVARSFNVWATTADGQFKAVTAPGSVANDPKVVFDLGPRQIDATLFHKALITINYDGPWGLGDGPGGGLVGRIVWVTQDGRTEQVSLPIVMLTGLHTYIVALRTVPATAYVDPAGNSAFVGWGTGAATFVSQFRFDPHEDPGARSWQIYDVQLLRDEAVDPTFPIHFQDNTWASGTSANLYADTDRDAGNGLGTLIASNVAVGAGVNTFNWNGGGVGPGAYWIHAELTRSGRTVASTSTGQLDVALGGAGAPPGPPGAAPAAAPSDANARLYAFFVWLVRSLNACQTAQRRHQKAIYNTPFCRSLLAAAARSRKVVKKRR